MRTRPLSLAVLFGIIGCAPSWAESITISPQEIYCESIELYSRSVSIHLQLLSGEGILFSDQSKVDEYLGGIVDHVKKVCGDRPPVDKIVAVLRAGEEMLFAANYSVSQKIWSKEYDQIVNWALRDAEAAARASLERQREAEAAARVALDRKELAEKKQRLAEAERKIEVGRTAALAEFEGKNGIELWINSKSLSANPFPYQGVTVGVASSFVEMIARDQALFVGFVVNGVDQTAYIFTGEQVALAVTVKGRKTVMTSIGPVLITETDLVGSISCYVVDCPQLLK